MDERSLRPDHPRMTDAELRIARDRLGVSGEWLAAHLKVDPRTYRRWELGQNQVPPAAADELARLLEEAEHVVETLALTFTGADLPIFYTYRDDTAYGEAEAAGLYSAGWHRAIAGRLAQRIPGLAIAYWAKPPILKAEHTEQLADVLLGVYIDAVARSEPRAFLIGEIEDCLDDATGKSAYPELLAEARAWTRGQAAAILEAYLASYGTQTGTR